MQDSKIGALFCNNSADCTNVGVHAQVEVGGKLISAQVDAIAPDQASVHANGIAADEEISDVALYSCVGGKACTSYNVLHDRPVSSPRATFQIASDEEVDRNFGRSISKLFLVAYVTAINPGPGVLQFDKTAVRFAGGCLNGKDATYTNIRSVPADEVSGEASGPHWSWDNDVSVAQQGVSFTASLGQVSRNVGARSLRFFGGPALIPIMTALTGALVPIKASADETKKDQTSRLSTALRDNVVPIQPGSPAGAVVFLPKYLAIKQARQNDPKGVCAFMPTDVAVDLDAVTRTGLTATGTKVPE